MVTGNDIEKNGVYAPELLEFVRLANDFCKWLEKSETLSGTKFISESVQLLPEIYYRASILKETEPVLESGNEKFVTEQDWSEIYQKVLHLLGPHNSYLRIAANDEFDRSDLSTHTISEDLADIYQDLKDFTRQFRQGCRLGAHV